MAGGSGVTTRDEARMFSLYFSLQPSRAKHAITPSVHWRFPNVAMNAAEISDRDTVVLTPTTSGLFITRYPVGYCFIRDKHTKQKIPTLKMETAEAATDPGLARPEYYKWDIPQLGQIRIDISPDRLYLLYGAVLR